MGVFPLPTLALPPHVSTKAELLNSNQGFGWVLQEEAGAVVFAGSNLALVLEFKVQPRGIPSEFQD